MQCFHAVPQRIPLRQLRLQDEAPLIGPILRVLAAGPGGYGQGLPFAVHRGLDCLGQDLHDLVKENRRFLAGHKA